MKKLIPLFIIPLIILCSTKKEYSETKMLMGTLVTITVIADGESRAKNAMNEAFSEIARIEKTISYYNKDSDISKINSGNGSPVKVSEETIYLINKSNELSRLSDGAFDISFAGVGRLWKYGEGFVPPDETKIKENLKFVDYRKIKVDQKENTVAIMNGMEIGLGSIGKRYALGKAVETLKKNGITDGIVSAGDLQVIGSNFGKDWNVGLKNPRGEDILYVINAKDGETISTSGDYERFVMYNGARYHHIFDPRTGYPTNTFSSVTIITKVPDYANGLSTAIFVMGENNYRKLLKNFPDTYVILVDQNMKVSASKELKDRIKPMTESVPAINWID